MKLAVNGRTLNRHLDVIAAITKANEQTTAKQN